MTERARKLLRIGCTCYVLVAVAGVALVGGGCFSALRGLAGIDGGTPAMSRPVALALDAVTFPVQAVVFGPMAVEGYLRRRDHEGRRAAFSNELAAAAAAVRADPGILAKEGMGFTPFGARHLPSVVDDSLDLDDRALLTLAVDVLSGRHDDCVSNVLCRREWRADTLRMIEPWMFMSAAGQREGGAPYFLHPALPEDIAESYTNFPHFLREHDKGRLLEGARELKRGYFLRRARGAAPARDRPLREIDSFVLGVIGSTMAVTNWQRSGMWDSCIRGQPAERRAFTTARGATARVTDVFANRQAPHGQSWNPTDPLTDPTIHAMILEFATDAECDSFLKELVPVCGLVDRRFLAKIFYRPELRTGRVFAVCAQREGQGDGNRLFVVNLAVSLDVRFWTPAPEFVNDGPWATCY